MALAPATRLGPYEILAPLGAGGMGEVYRARDTRLERTVAIKILPPHLSSDPIRKQRFEREAKIVSSLNHPHICVLHDVGNQEGIDYLVMECLEGETLAKRLERDPLPLDQVLKYGAQIADALDKAHRSGVAHRDLKPGNIMLTPTGAKLLDFGLAKPVSPLASLATLTATKQESPVTEDGTIVGTFQYMSPDQVEGKELDGRSDIFSLGAVLYEMVTGKRAFEGKTQLSVASAILERESSPIAGIKPTTPPALDHAIKKCLAKLPEDRWQSASDLASELKWIAEAGSQAGVAPSSTLQRRVREHLPWTVATLAILAVLAVWFFRPNHVTPAVPTYASIVPPAGSSFQIEGDLGAPPALAPDGSAVVFGAGDELWYHSLRTGAERVLPGAHGATLPFWSPDSSSIGFFADFKLKTLEISTGVIRTLCDVAGPGRGGSWSTSGVIVFAPRPLGALYQVPATGGLPSALTHLDPKLHTTHRWPFFLPDGQHFLYLATNHSYPLAEQNGIYLASLDGKVNRLLVSSLAQAVYAQSNLLYVKESSLCAQAFDLKSLALTGPVVRLGVLHILSEMRK
jgi:eukaryotic-like serine/threonine-protein kinase